MKSIRSRSLASFAMLPLSLAALSVEAENVEAGAPPADAPAAPAAGAAAEARKRAPAANFLPIVRGRLPLLFVHALRFDKVLLALGNKDAATKFATSVGKVFDIRKNRNFAYITESYKPSAEDVTAAEAWIAQVGGQNAKGQPASGDKVLMQRVLDEYKARGLATADDVAALTAARGQARKTAEPAAGAASTPAATLPGATEATQTAAAGAADDLLS